MKVLLVNGSPHEKGCTYTALTKVAEALGECGVDSEIFWVGAKPVGGCMACKFCRDHGACVQNDKVNEFAAMAKDADGFVFGSPVHYAAISGNMTSFMDRLFYSAGSTFRMKPAAGILSARRGGTTAAFDQINKYFTISQMPVVSSRYWNMVHGSKPEDVLADEEGVACMRQLGKNMAYLLKCLEAGKNAGVAEPVQEPGVRTDFIR